MNWEQVEGQWNEVKGHVKTKWGKLTDEDMTVVAGKKDILVGKIQSRYGMLKEHAENQVDSWLGKLNISGGDAKSSAKKAESPLK